MKNLSYHSFRRLVLAGVLFSFGSVLPSQAGIVLIGTVTDDASTGISTSKTYTHTVDFGNDNSAAIINGVVFTFDGSTSDFGQRSIFAPNTSYTTSTAGNALGFDSASGGTGGLGVLLDDFLLDAQSGENETQTLTLTGLTSGYSYVLRLYYRPFDDTGTRGSDITFNEGSGDTVTAVDQNDAGFHYLEYSYTVTGTTLTALFDNETDDRSFHQYGFTNELVAVPEPSTWAMLGLGLVGLVLLRGGHRFPIIRRKGSLEFIK